MMKTVILAFLAFGILVLIATPASAFGFDDVFKSIREAIGDIVSTFTEKLSSIGKSFLTGRVDEAIIYVKNDNTMLVNVKYSMSWLTKSIYGERGALEKSITLIEKQAEVNIDLKSIDEDKDTATLEVSGMVDSYNRRDVKIIKINGIKSKYLGKVTLIMPDGYFYLSNGRIPSLIHYSSPKLTSTYFISKSMVGYYEKLIPAFSSKSYDPASIVQIVNKEFVNPLYEQIAKGGLDMIVLYNAPHSIQYISDAKRSVFNIPLPLF